MHSGLHILNIEFHAAIVLLEKQRRIMIAIRMRAQEHQGWHTACLTAFCETFVFHPDPCGVPAVWRYVRKVLG